MALLGLKDLKESKAQWALKEMLDLRVFLDWMGKRALMALLGLKDLKESKAQWALKETWGLVSRSLGNLTTPLNFQPQEP
jgi:hypothetical protein